MNIEEIENRLLYLESLHTESNAHLLNNDFNEMLPGIREDRQDYNETIESLLKITDNMDTKIAKLKVQLESLTNYIKNLSGQVTTLQEIVPRKNLNESGIKKYD